MKNVKVLGQIGRLTILNRGTSFEPIIVASGYNEERGDWMQGAYFDNFEEATIYALAELGENTPTTIQMQRLSRHYQIANLADYLEENYKKDRQDCWDWATEARQLMLEEDVSEEFAVNATKERYM